MLSHNHRDNHEGYSHKQLLDTQLWCKSLPTSPTPGNLESGIKSTMGPHALPLYSLPWIPHTQFQINVGTGYEIPHLGPSLWNGNQLHHGQPNGFHLPTHVYLLRSPYAAMGGKLEIKYVLPIANFTDFYCARLANFSYWVLAHKPPHNHHFLLANLTSAPGSWKHVQYKLFPPQGNDQAIIHCWIQSPGIVFDRGCCS